MEFLCESKPINCPTKEPGDDALLRDEGIGLEDALHSDIRRGKGTR